MLVLDRHLKVICPFSPALPSCYFPRVPSAHMAVQCVMEQLFFVLILKDMSQVHGWDKNQNFLPVGYVYVSLATVKSQIQEMVELNTFFCTKGESQPAPRLLLFPFLSFIPTCIFASVLVVV